MSAAAAPLTLPRSVSRTVARLRRMVRLYVLGEGLAWLVIVACAVFWIALAIDWLLEPSPTWRVLMWAVALAAFVRSAWRRLFRRLFARLSDDGLALAVERRYPLLQEGLITSVQASRSLDDGADHRALVATLYRRAATAVKQVRLPQVISWRPLVRTTAVAVALAVSVGAFAFARPDAFAFFLSRAQLRRELWPRHVALTVVGFEQRDQSPAKAIARGDEFELVVLASLAGGHKAPDEVEVSWRRESDDGRGGGPMTQIGDATGGADEVEYRYRFKVTGDIEFDVRGGDDRIRNMRLRAVDRPTVTRIVLDCIFPAYLRREPRSIPVSGRVELPDGTTATVRVETNKPLSAARIEEFLPTADATSEDELTPGLSTRMRAEIPVTLTAESPAAFTFPLSALTEDRTLLISLDDQEGVSSRDPFRFVASAIPDEAPEALVQLAGIGSAVTPQAVIPFEGRLRDDYALEQAWFEYQIDDRPLESRPLATQPEGLRELPMTEAFDLAEPDPATRRPRVSVEPGQRLTVALRATDAYSLGGTPHEGGSQRFALDVVTPSQLRALLEKRELSLRQRFEAIHEKMTGVVELLDRIELDQSGEMSPRDQPPAKAEGSVDQLTPERLRQRDSQRIGGADQSSVQLAFETTGVADGFDDIVRELINNRVDTEELKERLEGGIAEPLHRIGGEMLPRLQRRLGELQADFDGRKASAAASLADCRDQAHVAEAAMREVLDRMLELESYNELVELLRGIVDEQQQLQDRTRQEQRERLRGLLDD